MGKHRSKNGCLTCKARRVKCDETRPICMRCTRRNCKCQWEKPHATFREYQPTESSANAAEQHLARAEDRNRMDFEDAQSSSRGTVDLASPRHYLFQSPISPFAGSPATSSRGTSISVLMQRHQSNTLSSERSHFSPSHSGSPTNLTVHEAALLHHYTETLGRWLDCTDAARYFTLRVPGKAKECPVLLQAVLSFAARHRGDHVTASQAYQRCIGLLIERLNQRNVVHDDTVLSAIVILRFFEQLNVPSTTGFDNEHHLAGCAAILRESQGPKVNPDAPTMRDASFWVYVRQCLYNATINQQPPDVDLSLELDPVPASMESENPLDVLRNETAWANQMTWHCASVVKYCFGRTNPSEISSNIRRWNTLWDAVKAWGRDRPASFDPIWSGLAEESDVIPEIWFSADWHTLAFGYYHFSCILLLRYKPGPKFAVRNVGSRLSGEERQMLEHARAILGSCRKSKAVVPCLITLCHTVFVWGPLITSSAEQNELISLLTLIETSHMWPTAWIVNALKREWGTSE